MNKNIANFCNNLESTRQAFKQSIDRHPIPLDSASTTFMRSLNLRVSLITAYLNLLDLISFATVSFEELLGHCNQLYQQNHSQLLDLHYHLQSMGYISSSDDIDDLHMDVMAQSTYSPEPESKFLSERNTSHRLEDDPLFDEPPSLQNFLDLSESCMATLASEDDDKYGLLDTPPKMRCSEVHPKDGPYIVDTIGGCVLSYESKITGQASKMIVVSDDDYESLPSYMKSLAPWKDLPSAAEKMNAFMSKKGNSVECNFFHADERESMGLGPKGRSYLLFLVRMNRLVIETNHGSITYRVL